MTTSCPVGNRIKSVKIRITILILTLAGLTACAAPQPVTVSPSLLPTVTPSPTVATATQTPSPTATRIPSSTPILPTPVLPKSDETNIYLADLLFSQAYSNCQLPCWQGLIIGQSTPEQARRLFNDSFAFNGISDLSFNTRDTEFLGVEGLKGYYPLGYEWVTEGDIISIGTLFEVDKEVLAGIVFKWITGDYGRPAVRITPQQVIEEIGLPDHFLVATDGTARADIGNARIQLIYHQGIVVNFDHFIPIEVVFDPANPGYFQSRTEELCLDNQDEIEWVIGSILLTESFDPDLADLSSLQRRFTTNVINFRQLKPLSDVFDISPEGLTELVHTQDNVCLYKEAD